MLRRIDPGAVQLGMFIESFDGRWLAHPFWRSQFHLTDPIDVLRVQQSKIRAVIIDESKTLSAATAAAPGEMPVCVATDRTPDTVSTERITAAETRGAVAEDRRFTRYIADQTPSSTRAEHAEIVRVLGASAGVVRKAFAGLGNGAPLPVKQLQRVVENVTAAMTRNRPMMVGISRLKSKDEYTFFHSVAVGALMIGLGQELGLEAGVVHELGLGGLIHDVGKMRVPTEILNKPGGLSDDEFARMKQHPQLGYDILVECGVVSPIALEVTLRHHERIDGKGYPGGLAGDRVSLYARIAAICDVFDALTSARAYKTAMPSHEAITMMEGWTGQFDRDLLIAFMRSIGLYPAGLVVCLSSNRIGIMLPPGRKPGRPRARVFHCAIQNVPLEWSDVVISQNGDGEHVIAEAHPEDWAIEDWPMLCEKLLTATAAGAIRSRWRQ